MWKENPSDRPEFGDIIECLENVVVQQDADSELHTYNQPPPTIVLIETTDPYHC